MPVVENVDKITETIGADRQVSSRSIAQELQIDHKSVLNHLRKVGFKKKLDMSQRRHLTDSKAWRAVGRLEGGQTQAEVAQAIGVSQSVISRIWNRCLWRLEVHAEDQDKIVGGQQRSMKIVI
ncbi:hypothetical protein TNCV_1818951 [Trichonephila clavipes]|nr:hypothetical protein TNCV_1818951 [Trichonephila clavipes]